nr:putative ribonuclease H-like domain-containing protein [Tanacetum cinerariifolium]
MTGDDNHNGDQHETSNPTPPVPPPTQQIPHIVSSIKLLILKKGEYDIWAMRMEHNLIHTDYPIWQVIQNSNGPVSVTINTNRMLKVLPPKITKEVLARERERKARTTLLMALPEDHLVKFYKMVDAKKMWEAIKSKLRTERKLQFDTKDPVGVDKTKVECFNCHKIGNFSRDCRAKGNQDSRRRDVGYNGNKARDNGRRLAYQDDSKALVTIDGEDIDWSGHVDQDAQNYAMMAYSFSNSDSENEKLQPVEAQLLCHQQNQLAYEEKIRFMKIDLDDKTDVLTYHKKLLAEALKEKEDLKTKFEIWQNYSKNLSRLLNTQMSVNDKFGLGYGDYRYGSILSYDNEVLQSVFMNKEYDLEDTPVNDRYAEGMHAVPPPMTGNYMPSGPDVEIDYFKFTYGPKQTLVDESDAKTCENASCEFDSSVETTTFMPAPVENAPKLSVNLKCGVMLLSLRRNWDTAVKASTGCNWRNKRNTWNKVFNYNSGLKFYKSVKDPLGRLNSEMAWVPKRNRFFLFLVQDDPHKDLKDKGIVDSRCSRHMAGNKAYLADYLEFKGGSVAFGGSNRRITGKGKIKADKKESNTRPLIRPRQSDNGTEFKNHDLIELCGLKGIKREYSNATTPQQNGVAERKNRTLIEAARTMLADLFLPTTFWAEAVNTACYVLNRVLVTKPQNKTPYELLTCKHPIISYLRPFGCHVTILNTIDQFGKFDGKSD